MQAFQQIIEHYESVGFENFCQNFKNRRVEDLEIIMFEFQWLYRYNDDNDDNRSNLISPENWMAFRYWEPRTQTDFLAYLAIKIAVLRN